MEKFIDKKTLVTTILETVGMVDAGYISCAIKRKLGEEVSKSQVSGILRAMYARGEVGKSNCGYGKTVYWLNKERVK